MSIRLMSTAWEARTDTPAEKLVLLALADRADDEGNSVRPGKTSVATRCRLDRRTVQRIMVKFEESGLLVKVAERVGFPSIYRIDVQLLESLTKTESERGAASDHTQTNVGRSETTGGAASDHTGVRRQATGGCGVRPPNTSVQPSLQPSDNHQDVQTTEILDADGVPIEVLPDVPAFAADWPVLHLLNGDFEIREPYASNDELRTGVIEWLLHRSLDKKIGLPTVFAMQRNNCGWWDRYPIGAIICAVNRAAGGKWRGIIEDVAREWRPSAGDTDAVVSSVRMKAQQMHNTMEQRQAMFRAASSQQIDASKALEVAQNGN